MNPSKDRLNNQSVEKDIHADQFYLKEGRLTTPALKLVENIRDVGRSTWHAYPTKC